MLKSTDLSGGNLEGLLSCQIGAGRFFVLNYNITNGGYRQFVWVNEEG